MQHGFGMPLRSAAIIASAPRSLCYNTDNQIPQLGLLYPLFCSSPISIQPES
jgi:hypothetical protein